MIALIASEALYVGRGRENQPCSPLLWLIQFSTLALLWGQADL